MDIISLGHLSVTAGGETTIVFPYQAPSPSLLPFLISSPVAAKMVRTPAKSSSVNVSSQSRFVTSFPSAVYKKAGNL